LNNDVHLRNRNTDGLRILSEETKQKIKLANSGKNGYWYGKPMLPKTLAAINRNRVKKHTPETIQKMSLTRISKGLSKGKNNPMSREDVILKWIKSNKIGPNKKELALFNILENIFPNKYKLNVKGEVLILGGKIPDFVDLNTRVIIELYGDYWHKGENENERINFFKNLGYNTLIIWEKELNFPEILKEKIKKFTQL
jgi:very-short-patch-repair endonuclease